MRLRVLLAIVIVWQVYLPSGRHAARAAGPSLVLDQDSTWRRTYRFGVTRYSPAAMKADAQRVLGRGLGRIRRETEKALRAKGLDPSRVDWREHVYQPMHRNFSPVAAPPPPGNWATVDFDDAAWVRRRGVFQGGQAAQITNPMLGQFDESQDLGLKAAYYRGRFVVDDPAKAGAVTLRVVYTGGVRVLVNGRELARRHLPPGDLAPETPAEVYPAAAYAKSAQRLRRRVLGPLTIDRRLLRKGVNVLAVEVRASDFHPVVLTNPRQPNWGRPTRPWPHAHLAALELRAGGGIRSAARRPAGVQVWVADIHHRLESTEFLPPGESPGRVRLVGVRGGTHAAQLAVGTDKALAGLKVTPGELTGPGGGAARLAPSAVRVLYPAAYPLDGWTIRRLGDERGLDASFPTASELAAAAKIRAPARPYLFDQLAQTPPAVVPANTCRPVWLSVRVPPAAAPGAYRGTVRVEADGISPVAVGVELEVLDWPLPPPKDFQTFVGCEQNPYGVARQYGVRPWSDEHFRLLDASFRQLGRIGNKWLNVPIVTRTEFGNRDDSMVRWLRKRGGGWAFDYAVLDRYLALAVKHCGRSRAVQFVVMHGMRSAARPPTPPKVRVFDEGSRRGRLVAVGPVKSLGAQGRQAWRAFATSLVAHMKARGLDKAMYWGAPLEHEADPDLKGLLASCAPTVYWTAGGHEMMANAKYAKNERFYRLITSIRYNGGWPAFREEKGWKSRTTHMLNPRVGGTVFALHTTSHPFAYRVLADRSMAFGRSGFTRVGADEWAAVHYDGMTVPKWLTGMPVLFVLWPGRGGAEPGVRFECLLEGIQEAEARIFLEQALDRRALPPAVAAGAREALAKNLEETRFFAGNSIIHSFERYHYRWQERSRRLYAAAARAAGAMRR